MPEQKFKIIRAPEEKPLTSYELKTILCTNRIGSEWVVVESEEIDPMEHLRIQTELKALNQKYQNLRQESNIMCDEMHTLVEDEKAYSTGIMASFYRLCNLLGR